MHANSDHNTSADASASAGVGANCAEHQSLTVKHVYHVECFRNGVRIWEDEFENLVTAVGKNKYLDATLKTGLASPAWYVGLITGPGGSNTYAVGDTMASHSGWSENATYSNGTRPAWTPGSVSGGSVDNSASKAVFNINGSATLAGCFLVDNSTIGGTSGTLLGEGNFSSGDRALQTGDQIQVTFTSTMS